VAQLVERWACNWKVAKLWFDSRCSCASLCPRERHLNLFDFPSLGQAVYPVWWPSQQNSYVGVGWQTQSIRHLLPTKKKLTSWFYAGISVEHF